MLNWFEKKISGSLNFWKLVEQGNEWVCNSEFFDARIKMYSMGGEMISFLVMPIVFKRKRKEWRIEKSRQYVGRCIQVYYLELDRLHKFSGVISTFNHSVNKNCQKMFSYFCNQMLFLSNQASNHRFWTHIWFAP